MHGNVFIVRIKSDSLNTFEKEETHIVIYRYYSCQSEAKICHVKTVKIDRCPRSRNYQENGKVFKHCIENKTLGNIYFTLSIQI